MNQSEFIPYGRQDLNSEDKQAVLSVLESDWLTQGPEVPKFEQALAETFSAKHAVAVNSATSALHLALLALEVGEGDWVWTSPNSFVASANAALYCGAQIDFVDIDPHTYLLSMEALENKLQQAEQMGRLPKVLVAVHFAGASCDMVKIAQLAQHYGFKVVEDAAHAIGAEQAGHKVGSCQWSDICVFSLHPVKIITSAEGGVALTHSAELATKMACLRSHGVTRDSQALLQPADGPWYYEQQDLGFNYRMTDLQAALGRSQLNRLNPFIARRRQLAEQYHQALKGLAMGLPQLDFTSAWHLYVIQVPAEHRLAIFQALRQAQIGVQVHYLPVHTQPYYQKLGFNWGDFPVAESYYQRAITLPLFASLTDSQQARVVRVLRQLFVEHGI